MPVVHINGFGARSTADMVMMLMTTSFLWLLLLLRGRVMSVPYKLVSIGARTITMRCSLILFAVIAQRHGALFTLAGLVSNLLWFDATIRNVLLSRDAKA
jgi:hypothetical protein